jgi:hypothetical protein
VDSEPPTGLIRVWPIHITHQHLNFIDLATHDDWSPRRLTTGVDYDRASEQSGVEWASLSELATVLPSPPVRNVSIAVRPSDLDRSAGMARTHLFGYSGRVHVLDGKTLRPGDVLVPDDPTRPAVLLDDRVAGVGFTASFEALRPEARLSGLEIWALLSSSAGLNARARLGQTMAVGPPKVPRCDVLDLSIPLFDDKLWQGVRVSLRQLQLLSGVVQAPRTVSRWRPSDLLLTSSWAPTEVLQSRSHDGRSALSDLCQEIRRGSVRVNDTVDLPVEGWLPVATTGDLNRGQQPRRWMTPVKAGIALGHPGDVLLGLLGEKATAAILTADVGVDHNVALLRFTDFAIRDGVVGYLNSPEGQSDLRNVARGDTIPHRSIATLRRLTIPGSANDALRTNHTLPTWPPNDLETDGPPPPAAGDLALRLQELLWPT